ncbi:MAG: hypothetical protein ACOC95_00475 [Planctomycetota bacterium]
MIQRVGRLMIAAALLGGCQAERYRSMQMGSVDYGRAYRAAVDTVDNYYPILSADADDGRIVTAPRKVSTGRSVLSRTAGREWAEMRIRRNGPVVWADIRVTVEHRTTVEREAFRRMLLPYRDVAPKTPAEVDPPYPDEGDTWTPVGTNTAMEWRILDALYDRLHE